MAIDISEEMIKFEFGKYNTDDILLPHTGGTEHILENYNIRRKTV